MKQEINLRLGLIALIAVIATTLGTTLVFYEIFQARVRNDLRVHGKILADTGFFQKLYEEEEMHLEHFQEEVLENLNSENLRITWISEDGTVLYDNDTDIAEMGNHLDRPEIKEAMSSGSGESVRKSDTLNMSTFYYAIRLSDGTVLRISTQARSITNMIFTSMPVILVIIILILGLCILIGQLLTAQLMRPINMMAENLDDYLSSSVYHELEPFAQKIRSQHEKILEAANSRQDFTAGVSHELKTPLTAISGYAELIENHMVDTQEMPRIARQIRHNAERLVSLINDIIRLSELDHKELPRQFEHLNLYKLAEDTCRNLRVHAEQRNVTLTCIGTNTMLTGDCELVKELLENLIQNAIRYNRDQGWVKVKVSSRNEHPILTVTDNGIGIPYDQQEHVFERFYRVDKSRSRETGGTGLGLAIVKHIAEIHHAEIQLDSEPARGTCVTVRF